MFHTRELPQSMTRAFFGSNVASHAWLEDHTTVLILRMHTSSNARVNSVTLSMLFAFYCHTCISFILLYLFIFVRYFLTFLCIYTYFFLFPLFTPYFLKIADWQSKAHCFLQLLTRERLFNFSKNALIVIVCWCQRYPLEKF